MADKTTDPIHAQRRQWRNAERRATRRLVEAHRQEYELLVEQELSPTPMAQAA